MKNQSFPSLVDKKGILKTQTKYGLQPSPSQKNKPLNPQSQSKYLSVLKSHSHSQLQQQQPYKDQKMANQNQQRSFNSQPNTSIHSSTKCPVKRPSTSSLHQDQQRVTRQNSSILNNSRKNHVNQLSEHPLNVNQSHIINSSLQAYVSNQNHTSYSPHNSVLAAHNTTTNMNSILNQTTLKDLCVEDKRKVGHLMQCLAQEQQDKEDLKHKLSLNENIFEEKLRNVKKENSLILQNTQMMKDRLEQSVRLLQSYQDSNDESHLNNNLTSTNQPLQSDHTHTRGGHQHATSSSFIRINANNDKNCSDILAAPSSSYRATKNDEDNTIRCKRNSNLLQCKQDSLDEDVKEFLSQNIPQASSFPTYNKNNILQGMSSQNQSLCESDKLNQMERVYSKNEQECVRYNQAKKLNANERITLQMTAGESEKMFNKWKNQSASLTSDKNILQNPYKSQSIYTRAKKFEEDDDTHTFQEISSLRTQMEQLVSSLKSISFNSTNPDSSSGQTQSLKDQNTRLCQKVTPAIERRVMSLQQDLPMNKEKNCTKGIECDSSSGDDESIDIAQRFLNVKKQKLLTHLQDIRKNDFLDSSSFEEPLEHHQMISIKDCDKTDVIPSKSELSQQTFVKQTNRNKCDVGENDENLMKNIENMSREEIQHLNRLVEKKLKAMSENRSQEKSYCSQNSDDNLTRSHKSHVQTQSITNLLGNEDNDGSCRIEKRKEMPCFSEDNVTFTKGQSYKQRKCVGIETAKEEREDKRGFLKKNILSEISHLSQREIDEVLAVIHSKQTIKCQEKGRQECTQSDERRRADQMDEYTPSNSSYTSEQQDDFISQSIQSPYLHNNLSKQEYRQIQPLRKETSGSRLNLMYDDSLFENIQSIDKNEFTKSTLSQKSKKGYHTYSQESPSPLNYHNTHHSVKLQQQRFLKDKIVDDNDSDDVVKSIIAKHQKTDYYYYCDSSPCTETDKSIDYIQKKIGKYM